MSGIFQEYAERLRNECGFTKLDSASCPRPSGRAVYDGNTVFAVVRIMNEWKQNHSLSLAVSGG